LTVAWLNETIRVSVEGSAKAIDPAEHWCCFGMSVLLAFRLRVLQGDWLCLRK
jgi:hypothetical protein